MKEIYEDKRLGEIINAGIAYGAFPGANICVVNKEESYIGSFGHKANIPSVEENDIDTLYDMASLTKVVCTTSCLLKCLEEGYFRLYDKVSMFLPRYKHDTIIRDLVTHTSGLPEGVRGVLNMTSRDEVLDAIYNTDLIYPKNNEIFYSDINYILIGLIIEQVSGMSLDAFAKKAIFDPLEMYNTGFCPLEKMGKTADQIAPTELQKGVITRGYVHDETARVMGGVAGHAGLFSCVKDLTHFISMILNDGMYNGKRILSKAAIDSLFRSSVANYTGSFTKPTSRRSIGWILDEENSSASDFISPSTILHTGFTGTNLWVDKEKGVGMAMLTNRVHPTRQNTKHFTYRVRVGNYVISHYTI